MPQTAEPRASGTPTHIDCYWLGQSTVFRNRVQSSLLITCNSVSIELSTGPIGNMPNAVHQQRKSFATQILQPANFSSWLLQFQNCVACDTTTGGVIQQATQSASNYTPITSAAIGDTQQAFVTDAVLDSALAAAFNMFISGI